MGQKQQVICSVAVDGSAEDCTTYQEASAEPGLDSGYSSSHPPSLTAVQRRVFHFKPSSIVLKVQSDNTAMETSDPYGVVA